MVLWLKEGKEKNSENVDVIGSHTYKRTRFPGYEASKVLLRIN